jgi:hypothetical protein
MPVIVTVIETRINGIHVVHVHSMPLHSAVLLVPPGTRQLVYNGLQLQARVIRQNHMYLDLVLIK